MRAIHRKLIRELWHLRGQALAIALVIAAGVATWVIGYSVLDSLTLTQEAYYREHRFAEVFAEIKRAPTRLEARIAEIPGVAAVETRTQAFASLEVDGFDDPITAQLVSIPDHDKAGGLNRLFLREGSPPEGADQALISEPFAEAHGLRPGDEITAIINGLRQRLHISGIALSPEFIYQIRPGDAFPDYERYAILWMREAPLSAAWDMENAFNNVVLQLEKGSDDRDVIEALDRLLTPYGGDSAYSRDTQFSHNYIAAEMEQLEASNRIVPILFLGVAAFLVNIVINRIIEQQRDEIAILKAFGYRNIDVGLHYLSLVMLIVVVGAIPGVLLGAWAGNGMAVLYAEFFRFPFLHYHLAPSVVIGAVVVAAAAAGIGALHAVRISVKLPPAEAMRPEPPADYRPTLVERIGAQKLFDQPSRMILRHIERKPLRAAVSVLGIALSGAILLVGMFQEDAITEMVEVQYGLAQREDFMVLFTNPTSHRALHEVAALPGVEQVEPFRAAGVILRAEHREYRTAIQAFERGATLHQVIDEDHRPIDLPSQGITLTEYIAAELQVQPGDWLEVEVLEGARPKRRVQVAGIARQFIGNGVYMELEGLNRLMREGSAISGLFVAVDQQQRQAVLDALEERPLVAGVTIREVAIKAFHDTMAETMLIMAFVNVLLAGSIAFGVIYNSARIAFSVHSRELASLRVLGFTRGEIAYILLGELALMTLAAIPLALWLGYWFCAMIVEGLASDLYSVPLVVHPSSYGAAVTVMVAAALLSALAVRHKLYRLDLVAVLKTRE